MSNYYLNCHYIDDSINLKIPTKIEYMAQDTYRDHVPFLDAHLKPQTVTCNFSSRHIINATSRRIKPFTYRLVPHWRQSRIYQRVTPIHSSEELLDEYFQIKLIPKPKYAYLCQTLVHGLMLDNHFVNELINITFQYYFDQNIIETLCSKCQSQTILSDIFKNGLNELWDWRQSVNVISSRDRDDLTLM